MNSFRASSDLVKIVCLLMPALIIMSLVYAISKLRRPAKPLARPLPVLVFDTPDFGRIEVYRAKEGALLETLTGLEKLAPCSTQTMKPAKTCRSYNIKGKIVFDNRRT